MGHHNKDKETLHERKKYWAYVLAGICTMCHRRPVKRYRRCTECRAIINERRRKNKRKPRPRIAERLWKTGN